MDREFCLYLIEMLDEQLPITGPLVTLDFADTDRIDTYHINASLHLAIPLSLRASDGEERCVVEDVGVVDLYDEEEAIEELGAWCDGVRALLEGGAGLEEMAARLRAWVEET